MKKNLILSGLWLFLLSPVFLCAQVTVDVTAPAQIGVCQENVFSAEISKPNGQNWPPAISVTYNLAGLPLGANACNNYSRLTLINATVLDNNNNVWNIVGVQNTNELVIEVATGQVSDPTATTLTFNFGVVIDCSILPTGNGGNNLQVTLNETWYGVGTTQYQVNNPPYNVAYPFLIPMQMAALQPEDEFPSSQNIIVKEFYTVNTGNQAANIDFQFSITGTQLCEVISNSNNIEYQYSIAGGNFVSFDPSDWNLNIQLNTSEELRIRLIISYNCLLDCNQLTANFEWRCGAIYTEQCENCPNSNGIQFQLIDYRNTSFIVSREAPTPNPPPSYFDSSCMEDVTPWVYKIMNNGPKNIDTLEIVLNYLYQSGWRALTLVKLSSIHLEFDGSTSLNHPDLNDANCSTCALIDLDETGLDPSFEDITLLTNPNSFFAGTSPIKNYRVRISNLDVGEHIYVYFETVRSGPALEFNIEPSGSIGYNFNRYSLNIKAIDGCGIIYNPSNPLPYSGVGYICGEGYHDNENMKMNLVFNPVTTDLSVLPAGSVNGDYADFFVRSNGLLRVNSAFSAPYFADATNTSELNGVVRVDVRCEPGLRIRTCDFHRIGMSGFMNSAETLSLLAIDYNPDSQLICDEFTYSFYFGIDGMSYNAVRDFFADAKFDFRLTSCCPLSDSASMSPSYFISYYILPNLPSCYTNSDFFSLNWQDWSLSCTENEVACDESVYDPECSTFPDCEGCIWLPLAGVSSTINIHCPGCLAPGIIVSKYSLKRKNLGFEDLNSDRIADDVGSGIQPINENYGMYNYMNIHGSNFGDFLVDTLQAWFVDGDNTGNSGGYSYEGDMLQNHRLTLLQLQRQIQHMDTVGLTVKSFTLYIDQDIGGGVPCCDCEGFYDQNSINSLSTIMKLKVCGDDLNDFLEIDFTGGNGTMLFTFDETALMNVNWPVGDGCLNSNLFNGFYTGQKYRLVTEYEVCANFHVPTGSEPRKVSEINNLMWLSGREWQMNEATTSDQMPNTMLAAQNGLGSFPPNFEELFIFYCEAYGGRHFFYAIHGASPHEMHRDEICAFFELSPATLTDWCTKRFEISSTVWIGSGADDFPFEFKGVPNILDTIGLKIPAGWAVTKLEFFTRSVTNSNAQSIVIFDNDVNPLIQSFDDGQNWTYTWVPIVPLNNDPIDIECESEFNSIIEQVQKYGDEVSKSRFRFTMRPLDCDVNAKIVLPGHFLRSQYRLSNEHLKCNEFQAESCDNTTDYVFCDLNFRTRSGPGDDTYLSGPNPNLQLTLNPSQENSGSDVCWQFSLINDKCAAGATQAPFVFIEVPDSPYLDNWSINFGTANTLYTPSNDGYFEMFTRYYSNSSTPTQANMGRICAQFVDCIPEVDFPYNIDLVYGWNCGGYPPSGMFYEVLFGDTIYEICWQDTLNIPVNDQQLAYDAFVAYDEQFAYCDDIVLRYQLYSFSLASIYPQSFHFIGGLPVGMSFVSAQLVSDDCPDYSGISLLFDNQTQIWSFSDFVELSIFGNQCLEVEFVFHVDCGFEGIMPAFEFGFDSYCTLLDADFNLTDGVGALILYPTSDNCSPPCYICEDFSINAQQSGCSFDFSAQVPYFEDCTYSSVQWNFGDGNFATGNNVQHNFNVPGNYNVSAEFICFVDGDSIICQVDTLVACGPCLDYNVEVNPNNCDIEVLISQQSSCAFTSTTVNYGDGTLVMGNNQFSFTHSYSQSGVYQIYIVSHCFDAEMNFVHSCSYLDSIEVRCDSIKELDDFCFFIRKDGNLDEVTSLTKKDNSSLALVGTMHREQNNPDKYLALISAAQIASEWQNPGSATPYPAARIGEANGSTITRADKGKSVLIKGNYIFSLGETTNINSGDVNLVVTCFNWVEEEFEWSHEYNSSGVDIGVKILDMAPNSDKILIIGNTKGETTSGSWDIFALKLGIDGSIISSNILVPNAELNQAEFATDAVKLDGLNEYAIVGNYFKNDDSDMLAFKIDYDLQITSTISFIGSDYEEKANGIVQVGSRLYVVGSIDQYNENSQVYVVELNANNMQPTSNNVIYLSTNTNLMGNKIIVDEDGDLIVAGYAQFDESIESRGLVIKLAYSPNNSKHLDLMWASITNMDESAYFNDLTLHTTNYAMVGGAYEIDSGDTDMLLVQVDTETGEACCLKPVSLDKKAHIKSSIKDIGKREINWSHKKYGKMDKDFRAKFICVDNEGPELEVPLKSAVQKMNFSVFPNPNRGSFTVSLSEASDQLRSIIIFDVSGRIVEQVKFDFNGEGIVLYDFDVRHLQSGVYLLKVESLMGSRTTRVSVLH
jgi:hypothetical protein